MSSDVPYKLYGGLSRKEQKKLAKYGPVVLENDTFDWVEGIVRENNLDLDGKREHWFRVLLDAIERADGKVLRLVAEAAESVGKSLKGQLHDATMLRLLEAVEPPESWRSNPQLMGIWAPDLAPTKKEFILKTFGNNTDAAQRDLRHRLTALNVQLNDAKPGPREPGLLRVESQRPRKHPRRASTKTGKSPTKNTKIGAKAKGSRARR